MITDALGNPHPSSLPGGSWPNVLFGEAAEIELLQTQFRITERSDPAIIRTLQNTQMARLAKHAHSTSSFWRQRLDDAGYGSTESWFTNLPFLTRGELKTAGPRALALPLPMGHGETLEMMTSGSTGAPLKITKTDVSQLFWSAITLRDSLWHRRDLGGKLAVIRVGETPRQIRLWGAAYLGYSTGPCVMFDARSDINSQLDWLQAEQPSVLLTHPSNLRALVLRSVERNIKLHRLTETRTYSEQLAPNLRDIVRKEWGVPVSDLYSANEVGYVALQCPESGLYHVQAEDVLVEIIGDDGRPCNAGESGRVIVTALHNFAMPFVRYELGDYATAGGPCSCGRTLPTLERILGRVRNMLQLPGGRTAFPGFPLGQLTRLSAVREVKMIQHSLEDIELELVLDQPLTDEEEAALTKAVCKRLQHPFRVQLTPVQQITRGNGYKREDFECRMN